MKVTLTSNGIQLILTHIERKDHYLNGLVKIIRQGLPEDNVYTFDGGVQLIAEWDGANFNYYLLGSDNQIFTLLQTAGVAPHTLKLLL